MTATDFAAEVTRSDDGTVIRLRGELEEDESAARARAAFEEALGDRPARLVIDLSELEFMGSTGIWLMVEAHRRCVEAGIQLGLQGKPQPLVAHALALSGVEELSTPAPGAASGDGHQPIELRLYLSSRSTSGAAAAGTIRALTDRLAPVAVDVEIIDVFEAPARAKQDRVIATPTLIKVQPPPELRLIGSIADPDSVLRHLGLAHLVA